MNVCNISMGKSKTCKFFVVEDKCNPIVMSWPNFWLLAKLSFYLVKL